jgi:HTH-type transcriptional regulator/antitoxin HigA
MDIRPINTNEDYELALSRLTELMDARGGTPQGDELDILAGLIDVYESQRFPIESPD